MFGEPLDQLRDQLDPRACRLANLPEKIWLFGGQGTFRLGPSESVGPSESLRESFWRQSLGLLPSPDRGWIGYVDLPENYADWWAFSGYDDLLLFERDACHLARAVVLFPESPGSLAELGALSVDASIVDRLLVVVPSRFLQDQTQQSFLNLGPLKRAQSRGLRCVISGESTTELSHDDFETVMEFVGENLPRVPSTEKLRVDNPTHTLLLIADLVDLLLVSKLAELRSALAHFEVTMSEVALGRAVDLLKFLQLIRVEFRGKEPFYVRREHANRAWVDYTAKHGQPAFDRSRFKIDRTLLLDRRQRSILERPL